MSENYIYHHGIQGQKWGVRRYQNPDGTLTSAGRERYQKETFKQIKKATNPRGNLIVIPYGSGVHVHYDNGANRRAKNTKKVVEKVNNSLSKKDTKELDKLNRKSFQSLYKSYEAEGKYWDKADELGNDRFSGKGEKELSKFKREMDVAGDTFVRDYNAFKVEAAKVGKSVSEEILGKYADKSVGKNQTAERYVEDLIESIYEKKEGK